MRGFVAALFVLATSGAVIDVTCPSHPDPCPVSLIQDAVAAAAQDDIVLIGDGTYVNCTSQGVTVSESMTIRGSSSAGVVIDCEDQLDTRAFSVATVAITVYFQNMTIQNAVKETGGGSAIFCEISTVYVEDTVIRGCTSTLGVVYINGNGGSINIRRSSLEDNFGSSGLVFARTIDVADSQLRRNRASSSVLYGSDVYLTSVVAEDHAERVVQAVDAYANGCVFRNNTFSGGSLFESSISGVLSITDCLVEGNRGPITSERSWGSVTMSGSTFRNNVGGQAGILTIALAGTGTIAVRNSVFTSNYGSAAGVFYSYDSPDCGVQALPIIDVVDSAFEDNFGGNAGVHFAENSAGYLSKYNLSSFKNNTQTRGEINAAVRVEGRAEFYSCTFEDSNVVGQKQLCADCGLPTTIDLDDCTLTASHGWAGAPLAGYGKVDLNPVDSTILAATGDSVFVTGYNDTCACTVGPRDAEVPNVGEPLGEAFAPRKYIVEQTFTATTATVLLQGACSGELSFALYANDAASDVASGLIASAVVPGPFTAGSVTLNLSTAVTLFTGQTVWMDMVGGDCIALRAPGDVPVMSPANASSSPPNPYVGVVAGTAAAPVLFLSGDCFPCNMGFFPRTPPQSARRYFDSQYGGFEWMASQSFTATHFDFQTAPGQGVECTTMSLAVYSKVGGEFQLAAAAGPDGVLDTSVDIVAGEWYILAVRGADADFDCALRVASTHCKKLYKMPSAVNVPPPVFDGSYIGCYFPPELVLLGDCVRSRCGDSWTDWSSNPRSSGPSGWNDLEQWNMSRPCGGMVRPNDVQCALAGSGVPVAWAYKNVFCSLDGGPYCLGSDNINDSCDDIQVRYCCPSPCGAENFAGASSNCGCDAHFGDSCSWECTSPYFAGTEGNRTCESADGGGQWTGPQPACTRVACPLEAFPNAATTCSDAAVVVGETCEWTCADGFSGEPAFRSCNALGGEQGWVGGAVSCSAAANGTTTAGASGTNSGTTASTAGTTTAPPSTTSSSSSGSSEEEEVSSAPLQLQSPFLVALVCACGAFVW